MPGAISYAVTIIDSATGTYNLSGPPFPGDKVAVGGKIVRAPAGKHRWGLSSYGANTRGQWCADAKAGFLNGKRWKVTKAVALVAGKPEEEKGGTIAGRVVETKCDDKACTNKGLAGVAVSASGAGGGRATTAGDGRYSIDVKAGSYRVTPSLKGREFEPESSQVSVPKGGSATANFKTCAEGRTTESAGASAATTATSCDELRIDWTMPDHIRNAGWNTADEPSKTYVNPTDGWQVKLFLKKASGAPVSCVSGHSYTWRIAPRGTKDTKVLPGKSCRVTASGLREGVYAVKVEERQTNNGKLIAKAAKNVVVQDFLLVGLGDSNGSGQANPPYWNKQCDRSDQSYQMKAAEYVERTDDRTSVTFVHLACSGARTVHVADRPYVGQDPGAGSGLIQPQLMSLKQAMSAGKPVREIDAMILSIGINDLRFGGIVSVCLTNARTRPLAGAVPCYDLPVVRAPDPHGEPSFEKAPGTSKGEGTLRQAVDEEVRQLPGRYATLKQGIARRVSVKPKRIIATTYPDESWRKEGVLCDETSGYIPRLFSEEWGWLSEAGGALNKAVAAGFASTVTTIPGLFIGHGYCTPSNQNWFRSVTSSFYNQGNPYGTFHATREGHNQMGFAVVSVLCQQLYPGQTKTGNCTGTAREPGTG